MKNKYLRQIGYAVFCLAIIGEASYAMDTGQQKKSTRIILPRDGDAVLKEKPGRSKNSKYLQTNFTCEICKKSFFNSASLSRHQTTLSHFSKMSKKIQATGKNNFNPTYEKSKRDDTSFNNGYNFLMRKTEMPSGGNNSTGTNKRKIDDRDGPSTRTRQQRKRYEDNLLSAMVTSKVVDFGDALLPNLHRGDSVIVYTPIKNPISVLPKNEAPVPLDMYITCPEGGPTLHTMLVNTTANCEPLNGYIYRELK